MCDPQLLIGAALSGAGGILRGQSNAAYVDTVNKAQKDAFNLSKNARTAEIGRQGVFENQSVDAVNGTVGALGKGTYDASREGAISDFMATLDQRPSSIPGGFTLSGQTGATPEVAQEIARRAAAAATEARDRVGSLAKLTSYDAASLDRTLALAKDADTLSTIGGFRRGSLGAAQMEQTIPAAQVTPNDNILADILSGTGGLVSGYNNYQLPPTTGSAWLGGWGSEGIT